MKSRKLSVAFLAAALLTFVTTALVAEPVSLNPTVKVRARANAPVPAECDESLAPQPAQRIEVAEIPVTDRARAADLQPPPARGLRDQLAEAQAAVERNDRTAFNEWLTLAKNTVTGYPPGGDRTAASAAIAVYDDVGRLWDYQFASPTGAFFDATVQDGSLLAAMLRYPAYEEFISRQTLTDANGTRFYPTRETREFLARIAAQRLEKMGVRATASQRPPAETRVSPQPAPPPVRAGTVAVPSTGTGRTGSSSEPAVRSTTGQRSSTSSTATRQRRRPTRKTTNIASSTSPTTSSSRSGSSSATSGRRTPTKRAAANPSVARATAPSPDEMPIPAGVVNAPATATITPVEPPPVSESSASRGTETVSTETVSTSTAATTMAPATAREPAPQPVGTPSASRGRNLVFPLLLILIGVGVLILLFRASA